MLRGHSRPCHDGISNKQSAKERDRDRQRERQKQERAQMLPNDDKDSTSAQDLFHAPVRVEPSVEDRTTLEIRNTLGNFEHVRHYVVDGASGRNLIGVDQNSNNPAHRPSSRQSGSSTTTTNSGSKNLTIQNSHRNYAATNNVLLNSSSNNSNNVKASNLIHKVPQSQNNQLPHYTSQSGTINTSNSVLVPPGHSGKKSSGGFNNVFTTNNNNSEVGGVTITAKQLDKTLNHNNSNSVTLSTETSCTEIINEKSERGVHIKKPTLEREMIEVTTPLTPALTPKESPTKKFTPRRASKSEEKIVQSIAREGMTNIPSPLKKMDSSDSSSSDSESSGSDSEDSSSSSQRGTENQDATKPLPTTNSPTRWNLSSFIRNVKGTPDSSGAPTTVKSPKDGKSRDNPHGALDSEESPGEITGIKLESSVTSTSVFGKSLSNSPAENSASSISGKITSNSVPHASHLEPNEGPSYSKVPGKSPRKTPEVKQETGVPINKVGPPTIPKGTSVSQVNLTLSKVASLSATSSEDEDKKPSKESLSRSIAQEKPRTGGKQGNTQGKRKRPRRSSSSSEHNAVKSDDDDSSPETDKPKKDKKKNETILKLFRPSRKKERIESPNRENDDSKGNTSNSSSNNSGRGKGGGKGSSAATNRVLAKDSGRKSNSSSSSLVHNGDLDSKANNTKTSSSNSGSSTGKKRESSSSKDASHSSHHHGRKHGHKSHSNTTSSSSSHNKNLNDGTSATNNPLGGIINPSTAVMPRVKEEVSVKSHPSSLICRIPLFRLTRPPINSAAIKSEKESVDKGGESSSHRVRLHYDSSRVGSSSDQAVNAMLESHGDDANLSDSEQSSTPKSHSSRKRVKKKPKSPKKSSKMRREQPDSHSKNDVESEVGEVSSNSNVFGYAPCDSVQVSTTRTPPVEFDVQAPDSSINPLHLPSPAVPPQPIYFSYFEHNETQHHEDYYSRDQETYLEEAKRLKHKADNEKLGTAQASMYLEAGLYFILTGISMERDRAVGSTAAFTMYKDTLTLIRYIGSRFRSGRPDSNVMEAKIIVLSMRCQSLLSLKLFKIKSRETKEVVQYLTDHFSKVPPVEVVPIPNSPQLSTPSPHSPTSSPAGSSGLLPGHTPSPHPHQNHHVATVPRSIYAQMYKQCSNTMNLINAHELWETADSLVERYHMEDFFISIDRHCGPLTLHNSLVDLVRYVKHGLQLLKMLKNGSDIS